MRDQPFDSAVVTQSGVRSGWLGQPRWVPLKYMLTTLYGDALQARSTAVEGAWQASKPSPLPATTPGVTVVPVAACAGAAPTRPARTRTAASAAEPAEPPLMRILRRYPQDDDGGLTTPGCGQ